MSHRRRSVGVGDDHYMTKDAGDGRSFKPGQSPDDARRIARRLEGDDAEDRRLKALARRLGGRS